MSKRQEVENEAPESTDPDDKITMTRAERDALIASAAASGAVLRAHGDIAHEAKVMSQERRTAEMLGMPIPTRRPWKREETTATYKDYLMAGPVTCTLDIQVRDFDANGDPIEPPIRTVLGVRDWKFPPIADMARKFGMPLDAATVLTGGKARVDIDPDVRFSIKFLQEVANAYEKPVRAVFQGRPLSEIAMHLTGPLKPVDLGEIRRGGNW